MRHLKKDHWPFSIIVNTDDFTVDDWCKNTIGRRFVDWYSYRTDYNKKIFAFTTEESLLIFKLTWGNK